LHAKIVIRIENEREQHRILDHDSKDIDQLTGI